MSIVVMVLSFGILAGLVYANAREAFGARREFGHQARPPKADPLVIARLEHELGITHPEDACPACKGSRPLQSYNWPRFAQGGVIPRIKVQELGQAYWVNHKRATGEREFVRVDPKPAKRPRGRCHGELGGGDVWRTMECPHDL